MSNNQKKDDTYDWIVGLVILGAVLFMIYGQPFKDIIYRVNNIFAGWVLWFLILSVLACLIPKTYRFILYLLIGAMTGALFYVGAWQTQFYGTEYLGIASISEGHFLKNLSYFWQKMPFNDFCYHLFYPMFFYGNLVWLVVSTIIIVIILLTPKSAEEKLLSKRKDRTINIDKIAKENEKIDPEGFILGGVLWGGSSRAYQVAEKDLNRHTCLIGTTGSGKTVTLYNYINDALRKNKPVIYITAKYAQDDVDKFVSSCQRYGREYKIFTMTGEHRYNPFATGTATEITDKIIGMFDFSDDHYKSSSTRFLQLLIRLLQLQNIPVSFSNLIHYSSLENLNIKDTQPIAPTEENTLPSFEDSEEPQNATCGDERIMLYSRIKSIDKKAYGGFLNRLAILSEGDLGAMLSETDFNIDYAIENNIAVIFAIDSLAYQEQARQFGRLLVNDIKPAVSHHQQRNGGAVGIFFDEFNVFASHEVVDVVNKSRSANFQAVISFQSLADIDRVDPTLTRQIIQNCNTLIAHKQNEYKDSESLSNTFGTFETVEKTYATDDKETGADRASMRKVREYQAHPDDIKELLIGQAFIKSPSGGLAKIQVLRN